MQNDAVEQKLDTVIAEITLLKLSIVKLETLVEERRKEDLPVRVNRLERAQSRILGWGAAAVLFVPMLVTQLTDMIKSVVHP